MIDHQTMLDIISTEARDACAEHRKGLPMKHPEICEHPRFRYVNGKWWFRSSNSQVWVPFDILSETEREDCQAIQHMAWHRQMLVLENKAQEARSLRQRNKYATLVEDSARAGLRAYAWLNHTWE